MNILFLTLVAINSIEERGIYQDLLRKFRNEGHDVTIVTPVERRKKIQTNISKKDGVTILQVKTLNITKTNVIEKGIGLLLLEYQFLSALKKHLNNKKFDLLLYSTPPITLIKPIEYVKNNHKAYAYLLLKDIFPQNAIDMNMMKKNGFLHANFRRKEKRLYNVSDAIGCMSQANLKYVLAQNPEISRDKVEVNPNTVEPICINYTSEEKLSIRKKYNLPIDKKILVYGGNLGKPQGLDFLLDTIQHCDIEQAFFLIIGDGTEFNRLNEWFKKNNPSNAALFQRLPKDDYSKLLAACDIGLIFLHKNFTIPNFPSRMLSYLELRKPIIAATDPNTDIGDIIQENGCGKKVLSGNQHEMIKAIKEMMDSDLNEMGNNCISLLEREYKVDRSYNLIINRIKKCTNHI